MNIEETNGHAEPKNLSSSDEWSTPQEMWDHLNAKYKFTWDMAASADNAKCVNYVPKSANSLLNNWPLDGWLWLNPPYSKPNLDDFMDMVRRQVIERGCRIVTLTPNSTSEGWFQRNLFQGMDIVGSQTINTGPAQGYMLHMEGTWHRQDRLFIKGRLRHGHGADEVTGAKKGSVLCAFYPKKGVK